MPTYETIRRHIPDVYDLPIRCGELKYRAIIIIIIIIIGSNVTADRIPG